MFRPANWLGAGARSVQLDGTELVEAEGRTDDDDDDDDDLNDKEAST